MNEKKIAAAHGGFAIQIAEESGHAVYGNLWSGE